MDYNNSLDIDYESSERGTQDNQEIMFDPAIAFENIYIINNDSAATTTANNESADACVTTKFREIGNGGRSMVTCPTIKCSSCSDDVPATSWCVECSEYICDSCVEAHQRFKITKNHTIKSKEEKKLMCHIHPLELSLLCETCDKLTCRDCQLFVHRDHKYKFLNEIALEAKQNLNSLLDEITRNRILLNDAINNFDDQHELIAEKRKELLIEITTMVAQITNTVNMRGKQLVRHLSEVCDGKLKVLNGQKDALQSLSNNIDHCIGFVKFALDKGSNSAVLYSKKTLTTHLQRVKSQCADIPNPEIPVHIQVQMNQVQETQKMIAQLGTIFVDGKNYATTTNAVPATTNAIVWQQHPFPPSSSSSSNGNIQPPSKTNTIDDLAIFSHGLIEHDHPFNAEVNVARPKKIEAKGELKQLQCTHCDYVTPHSSNLKKHMLVHSGKKPFACNECQQKFTQKSNLNRHMLVHSGKKPFACNECQQKFTLKSNLNRHMKVHVNDVT